GRACACCRATIRTSGRRSPPSCWGLPSLGVWLPCLRIRLTEVKPRRVSPTGVTGLNALSPARARAALLECCGSKRWADQVAAGRPYATRADALEASAEAWEALDEDDRLAAFAAHARIGEPDPADPRGSGEQAGAAAATAAERSDLRDANLAYESRFVHV